MIKIKLTTSRGGWSLKEFRSILNYYDIIYHVLIDEAIFMKGMMAKEHDNRRIDGIEDGAVAEVTALRNWLEKKGKYYKKRQVLTLIVIRFCCKLKVTAIREMLEIKISNTNCVSVLKRHVASLLRKSLQWKDCFQDKWKAEQKFGRKKKLDCTVICELRILCSK